MQPVDKHRSPWELFCARSYPPLADSVSDLPIPFRNAKEKL
jgi:hypothetical protein